MFLSGCSHLTNLMAGGKKENVFHASIRPFITWHLKDGNAKEKSLIHKNRQKGLCRRRQTSRSLGPGGGFPHTGRPGFCLASLCVFSRASCYLDKRYTVFGFKSEVIQPCFQLCPLPKKLYIEPGNKMLANHEMPIHGHE